MREKVTKLLMDAMPSCYSDLFASQLADHLIANDVVPVVRCKDCIHFDERQRTVGNVTGKVYCSGYCYHWDYEQGMSPNQVLGDDYCSYGERKEENEGHS